MHMSRWTRGSLFAALKRSRSGRWLGLVLGSSLGTGPPLADPDPGPRRSGAVRHPLTRRAAAAP